MKRIHRLNSFILALLITAAGLIPAAAHSGCSEEIIEHNLQKVSAKSVQEWIDGELCANAGIGSEWYIIALANYGHYSFSAYKNALNLYLSKNEVDSASSRLKYALTFVAIGDKSNPYIEETVNNSIGKQGIMSLVFGLHLLNNDCESNEYSQSELTEEILSFQLVDGGWAINGENGDVDATAMTVQALSPQYHSDLSVKKAVDNAVDFLSRRQNDDGGYSSYGVSNPESVSQVIIALSSLGIDAVTDTRFIKNGSTVFDATDRFRLSDGSYCHKTDGESNFMATVQVMCASIAYENMKNGSSSFYVFAENKTVHESTTETVTSSMHSLAQSATNDKKESESETHPLTVAKPSSEVTEYAEEIEEEKDFTVPVAVIIVLITVITVFLFVYNNKCKVIIMVVLVSVYAVIFALNYGFLKFDTNSSCTVTISIRCDTVKDSNKKHIPSDGIILDETEIEIVNGETVYDVLSEICKNKNILFSSNMGYIEGINNLYEMDFGESSGWVYFVNGEAPSVGCGSYELSDGDEILWCYTRGPEDIDIGFSK